MKSARGHVLLGVSGGIAAYKAAEVLRGFQRAGHAVRVTMTANATRFVAPLTFAALSGRPVSVGGLGGDDDAAMSHVEDTRDALLFVVAPATANTLARLAQGLADDWLGSHALACEAPLLLAPAMNQRMWRHPAVQENLERLRARGAVVVPPATGDLACGETGPGRLADPASIVAAGLEILGRQQAWAGRRVLVTSGPTFEDLDPVRFLGNRSSGKMGHALAGAAAEQGAEVILVSGPVALADPPGPRVVRVRSAEDMAAAVRHELPGCDAAFFAAAVADFRPSAVAAGKIRREGLEELNLELVRTPDVLAEARRSAPGVFLVGFAAETDSELEAAAEKKLQRKGCELIVANRVGGEGSAFDADESEVLILGAGLRVELARQAKRRVAERILELTRERLLDREATDRRPEGAEPAEAGPRAPRRPRRRERGAGR